MRLLIVDGGNKNEDKLTHWKRKEMDLLVTSVPGMENLLRRRDIPAFCRVEDVNDPGFQSIKTETKRTAQATALILNTFEDLEGPILDQIRTHSQSLLHRPLTLPFESIKLKAKGIESSHHSSSFWKEDNTCIAWLDSQPPKSVIYILVGDRPDSVIGDGNEIPVEIEEGTRLRGLMVEWVPQELVLGHESVGAFFTHSGWNSTLEGIVIGVPMLCWPYEGSSYMNLNRLIEFLKSTVL
ncbi:hypothetical protein SASPL_136642 [Salvia splendens]|uniref:Uncharacterized protein n=1 Tax=Salvia splendens TaxID=180675 RepID=A0A8X8ZGW5_SALSN|nr:hypothetical protein SASPL_136642 [Salvia splendens]